MTQPTALFLADVLEDAGKPADIAEKAAAELRRLHAQRGKGEEHMTTLRTAAQQALEALEEVQKYGTTTEWFDERVSALKAALAEPVQEPVADQFADVSKMVQEPVAWQWLDTAHFRKKIPASATPAHWRPLFTTPPQRKPLTEEEIYSLFRTVASPVMFARAIERAHGIT